MSEAPYPDVYFSRQDEADDALFYAAPRRETYLDAAAAQTLRETVFPPLMPAQSAVLDLMSGWRSHLPDALARAETIGLGMNADEMRENPQLSAFHVHDLNANPALPFPDAHFDAAVCTDGIAYLVRPVEVFREVRRVLHVGGAFTVSYSRHIFPDKAIWVWQFTDDEKHGELVSDYFRRAGFVRITRKTHHARSANPLFTITGYRGKR